MKTTATPAQLPLLSQEESSKTTGDSTVFPTTTIDLTDSPILKKQKLSEAGPMMVVCLYCNRFYEQNEPSKYYPYRRSIFCGYQCDSIVHDDIESNGRYDSGLC